MPRYIRSFVPGGTFFFTVTLLERQRRLLVERIDLLREAFSLVQAHKPFTLDAVVILPDHLHCIWTLPSGDADFSSRWHAIKAGFSRGIASGERLSERRIKKKVNVVSGSAVSGNMRSATSGISDATPITFTIIPSSMATHSVRPIGHSPAFDATSNAAFIRSIGVAPTRAPNLIWRKRSRNHPCDQQEATRRPLARATEGGYATLLPPYV